MSYATVNDMLTRFERNELVQLTDQSNTGTVDESRIEGALNDAASLIDGYLAARYQLPLSVVPGILARYASDIARWFLYDDHAPEHVVERKKHAIDYLKDVAGGRVQLDLDASDSAAVETNSADVTSAGTTFARDKSTGFI